MPSVGAPDLERAFALTHTGTTLVVFLVPGAVGLVVDPIVFLLADRYPRRWFIAGALGLMGLASFAAALARDPLMLAASLAVWFVAAGAAVSLAQATLVDRAPDQRARTMTRWTMCALAGDLVAPLAIGMLATVGLGWRATYVVVGIALVSWSLVIAARPIEAVATGGEDEAKVSLWQALRVALRDRTLVLWLLGTALCDLLDEILVVFASLHVRLELGASAAWQTALVGAFMLGGALGLVLLDRLLARHGERTLLLATGVACAATYALWLAAPVLWLSTGVMFFVGVTAAPLYPLAAARAYACRPGHSGVVLAASHLFTPLGLALPVLLGVVADRAGTSTALALLAVQPLGLTLLALAERSRP